MTPDRPGRFFCLPLKNRKNNGSSEHSDEVNDRDFQEFTEENDLTDHLNSVNHHPDSFDVINSFVDGCFIPPWDHIVEYDPRIQYRFLNEVVEMDDLWQDPGGVMELNSRQKTRFYCWARYFNICDSLRFFNSVPSSDRIMQGYVGDCSTVSSLSSLSEYEKLTKTPVLTDKIKLIDLQLTIERLRELGYPEGYINYLKGYKLAMGVKIHFNGCSRCLLVDDWVPVKKDKTPLCAHSNETGELWVTLFEKANVRLSGKTYSIKGTNPGVDIYHLTGWIPEIIKLPPYMYKIPNKEGHESLQDRFNTSIDEPGINIPNMDKWDVIWRTIVYNFNRNLVMCLGTNELYDVTTDNNYIEGISMSSGIVSGHAYSVLKVKEIESRGEVHRVLLLKNPWGKVRSKLELNPEITESLTTSKEDDGIFWIEWMDVLKWFSHLYLSWNKEVFQYSDKVNFKWNKNDNFLDSLVPEDSYLSLFNPQISVLTENKSKFQNRQIVEKNELRNESGFKRYLNKYETGIQSSDRDDPYSVIYIMLIQNKNRLNQKMKYLATHMFEGISRIITPNNPIVNGVYNNSEIILTKIVVINKGENDRYKQEAFKSYGKFYFVENNNEMLNLVLLVCCYLKKIQNESTYTIFTYSNKPVKLKKIPYLINHFKNKKFDYEWTEYDSGKNPNDIWSYFTNPHFRLEVTQDTNAIILLETDSEISVNMRLFPARVATVKALRTKKAKSSKEYKLHCCAIQGHLRKGTYTIIPSNFKGVQARFRFNIFYEKDDRRNINLYPIPYPLINLTNMSEKDIVQLTTNEKESEFIGKEYKIDGTDTQTLYSGGIGERRNNFDTFLKRYYLLNRHHIIVTKMINDSFDFMVKEESLLSIKIKVNTLSDSKFVLFAEDCPYFPMFTNDEDTDFNISNRDHSGSQESTYRDDLKEENTKGGCKQDGRSFCRNLSCVDCGGPSGRFYRIGTEFFENEYNLGFQFCLFSDLNGGLSKNGRNPSNSAHVLFTNDNIVTFTLVDLLPGVKYRLMSLGQFRLQTLTLISNSPVYPVD